MTPHVNDLIPMAHVADVDRSIAFYERLGFIARQRLAPGGTPVWAMLEAGKARLMLARASGKIDAAHQAVLLYLYTPDVRTLREHLLASGTADAGRFTGAPLENTKNSGLEVVYDISRPPHMPAGELRVHDPDGYVLLIGQLA